MAEEISDVKSAGTSSPRSLRSCSAGKASTSSPHSPSSKQCKRIRLTEQQLDSLSKEEISAKWKDQDFYLDFLETQASNLEGDITTLKESELKYKQQYAEASHREKILVRRLASKEQELQEYLNQISEMKAAQAPSAASMRSTLLDPAVNILIQKLRQELVSTKAKLEDTQNELSAWKFTPDSNTGKRLMAKCRLLIQENEELGRMISSGRIAKLEGELALQKRFSEEVKKSQSELDEFLQDLDEDVEGMQSTIYFLQQELRKARESVTLLQHENASLKASNSENSLTNGLSPHTPPIIKKEEAEEAISIESPIPRSTATLDVKLNKNIDDSERYKGAQTPPLPERTTSPCTADCASVERIENKLLVKSEINDESSSDSAALVIKVENEQLSDRDDDDDMCTNKRNLRTKTATSNNKNNSSGKTNGEEVLTRTTRVRERTKRDKSAASSEDERVSRKKKRRDNSHVDYNEGEDSVLLTNGEAIQTDQE